MKREDSERSSRSGKEATRKISFNKRNQKPDIPQSNSRDQSSSDRPYLNHDGSQHSSASPENQRSQNYDHESSPNSSTNLTNINSGSTSSLSSNRYPSGTPSLNLSELKKYRSEGRSRENSVIDAQVQDMFLTSLQTRGNKYSTSPSQNKEEQQQHSKNNGHNNNTPYFHNESMKKFKAPGSAPVVGGEEKVGCCTIQ